MTSHAGSCWPHHSLPAWPSCPWAQITSLQNWSPHDGRPFYAFTNLDNFFPQDLLSTPIARHSSWNSCENFEKLSSPLPNFRGWNSKKGQTYVPVKLADTNVLNHVCYKLQSEDGRMKWPMLHAKKLIRCIWHLHEAGIWSMQCPTKKVTLWCIWHLQEASCYRQAAATWE